MVTLQTEKRYQVFVSSTFTDLQTERSEVIQALLELDAIPSGMEMFPAANDDQWTLIRRVIDDCDYYIVILAGRYGSTHPDTGISYTEMEYRYALQLGKPVLAFVHKAIDTLPFNMCETTDEGREKLKAFRTLVQKKMCRHWSTPAELGSVVSRSLVKLMKQSPAIGWVRADQLDRGIEASTVLQDSTKELLALRREVEQLRRIGRRALPSKRRGITQEARVGGHEVVLRTSEYEDGKPAEITMSMHKEGAAFRSTVDCLAMAVSAGLQHGIPLDYFVDLFTFTRFEPQGVVEGHPNIKIATSFIDYVFRVLGYEYLRRYDLVQVPPANPKMAAAEADCEQTYRDAELACEKPLKESK